MKSFALLSIVGLLAACSSLQRESVENSYSVQSATCLGLFESLDTLITAHEVVDRGAVKTDEFPFLRANRFLASFSEQTLSSEAYEQWLEMLRQTDEDARMLELANLSSTAANKTHSAFSEHESLRLQIRSCGRLLTDKIRNDVVKQKQLQERLFVPDHYANWKRVVGLYPLARIFAEHALESLHQSLQRPFQQPIEILSINGVLQRYRQQNATQMSATDIAEVIERSSQNPLHIPLPNPDQLHRLFQHFSPVWEIDIGSDLDKPGALQWDQDELAVNADQPVVYVHHAHTRFRGNTLLQLVYHIWFPAREKTGWLDLYGGKLDSVIWRVTLDTYGVPLAYDSIHGCGCYYQIFPAQNGYMITDDQNTEKVLSPKRISLDPFNHRLLIRLAATTHYIEQVSAVREEGKPIEYVLKPYQQLRSLSGNDGRFNSIFGEDGIVAGSERTERFFLWPFGIASPGAMRQWGTHAIAFVGRRHFDDPYLLDALITGSKGH